jgi:predicted RNase H-like nuclease (RuvC/YqgF family)
MDTGCTTAIGILALVILGIVAMFLNYKAKFDKKSVALEKNDQQHEQKHNLSENRIEELEKKNGNEQEQINELKAEIDLLKKTKAKK